MATSKLTVTIDAELLETARDAVVWLNRHGDPALGHMSLRRLVELGLRDQLRQQQQAHDLVATFPPRSEPLTPGRPIST